jgi:2,4-dienoyl-CoA reductase-like NADH-dependent reductase (Old Yellow Enzyme family)
MHDSNPSALFDYVARALAQRHIAFIFLREFLGKDSQAGNIKRLFGGPVIANEKYDLQTAQQQIHEDQADAVAFGKAFIANADLVSRLRAGAPLNAWDSNTFYGGGSHGYTDYPMLDKIRLEQENSAQRSGMLI